MGNQAAKTEEQEPGLPPKKSGIPAPKEISSTTVSRDRSSLREQLKGSATKKMVPSASTSSLSTLAKRNAATAAMTANKANKLDAEGADKALLECQVKELMAEAKAKDFEITKLRSELQRHRGKAAASSPSGDSGAATPAVATTPTTPEHHGEGDHAITAAPTDPHTMVVELKQKNGRFQRELAILRDENQSLKEKLISLESESAMISNTNTTAAVSSTSPTKLSINGILPDCPTSDPGTPGTPVSKIPLKFSTSSSSDITKGSMTTSPSPDSSEFEKIPSRSGSDSSSGAEDPATATSATTATTARELSVESLTEKLQKMEESHHSTAEELQATLQELQDQQQVVTELTGENERLADQKRRLQTSLQEQRERVELLAQKNEALLLRLRDQRDESARTGELEQRYTELVESSRFEREKLVDIQQQLTGSLRQLEKEQKEAQGDARALREERELMRAELEREKEAREEAQRAVEASGAETEAMRAEVGGVRALVEAERQKVAELKAVQGASDSTELQGLLKAAHDERDRLEEQCSQLRQEVQQAHADSERTRAALEKAEVDLQQVLRAEEEQKSVLSGNVSELQDQVQTAEAQIRELKETIFELEDHVEQQQAVHLHTKQTIIDLENSLKKVEEHKMDLEKQIKAMNRQMKEDKEEWLRFQADLQTAVVVANDIKVEAQQEVRALRRHLQEEQERSGRLATEMEQLQIGRSQSDGRALSKAEERAQWCGIPILNQQQQHGPASANRDEGNNGGGGGASSQGKTPATVKSLIKNFDRPFDNVPAKALKVSLSSRSPLSGIPISTSPSATVHPTQRHTSVKPLSKTQPRKVNYSLPDPLSSPGEELKPASFMRKSPSLESVIKSPAALCSSLGSYNYTWDNSKLRAERKDPLAALAREYGGSKRNALLKWCQKKTEGYPNIDMTNFSSSWSDGLAFCALLHSYLPAHIPYQELIKEDKVRNLTLAFQAAESIGIKPSLDIDDMMHTDRPDWQSVMHYVSQIYKYFET
ncbi:cytospin-B isoform X2 [Engraulis encrasicolus]|uniref:cytospin-B isoform X2 n=1 Tax=Engraulis encrasicolus TaxID=184585 RepID=UPI002FCF0B8C